MGEHAVAYHRQSVAAPGTVFDYYRGREGDLTESALAWRGDGTACLGLSGEVTKDEYQAIFGPGGARDPRTGEKLASTLRPGWELVESVPKSVDVLFALGGKHRENARAILDAQSEGMIRYLEGHVKRTGGRRGHAGEQATGTHGLVWAQTDHCTSRAGDPFVHRHLLIANVVTRDDDGLTCALDLRVITELCKAATMHGRVHGAYKAKQLGYHLGPDLDRDDNPTLWRIQGIPRDLEELWSERAHEIEDVARERGLDPKDWRARQSIARDTRAAKDHSVDLADRERTWDGQLVERQTTRDRVDADVANASDETMPQPAELPAKRFHRADVEWAAGASVFADHPAMLDVAVDRFLDSAEGVALARSDRVKERLFTTLTTVEREEAIREVVERGMGRRTTKVLVAATGDHPPPSEIAAPGTTWPMNPGQHAAFDAIVSSDRAVEFVVGRAGTGKTTVVRAIADSYESAGWKVLGTATSSRAALQLADTANVPSSTVASLRWRLEHSAQPLNGRTLLVLDEAGMTDDPDFLALLRMAERAGTRTVLVGDHRQLSAVGPGGSFEALVERWPSNLHELTENVRQHDLGERDALEQLRAGDVDQAIDWYRQNNRILVAHDRLEAIEAAVDEWAADAGVKEMPGLPNDGCGLFAYQRRNVHDLNLAARARMIDAGRIDVAHEVEGYAPGDWIVTSAPDYPLGLVNGQRGFVVDTSIDDQSVTVVFDDGRRRTLTGRALESDHLAYGYAVTVHRSQGCTLDQAVRFEDGGGREVAYVAMSRARYTSRVVVEADSVDQAVADLRRDWGGERRERWVIDTERPVDHALDRIEAFTRTRLDDALDESILDPLHRAMSRQLEATHTLER